MTRIQDGGRYNGKWKREVFLQLSPYFFFNQSKTTRCRGGGINKLRQEKASGCLVGFTEVRGCLAIRLPELAC